MGNGITSSLRRATQKSNTFSGPSCGMASQRGIPFMLGRSLDNPNCPFCQTIPKSCEHFLRDCVRAKETWLKCTLPQDFFTPDFQSWFSDNINSPVILKNHNNISWVTLFSFLCWRIYIRRNQWVFNSKDLKLEHFWYKSIFLATEYAGSRHMRSIT